ncbi:MAG: mechanosensitive ion channel [Pseudomonadaceae bacterium]|nr:mechanosensitive ion channel [Pseudomonadaceae bacterium]
MKPPPFLCLKFSLTCLFFLSAVTFTDAAWAESAGDKQASAGSEVISTDSTDATDDAIQNRLEAIFSEVDTLSKVTVSVSEGVATLSGSTSNDERANSALNLAQRLAGVVTVQDEIQRTLDLQDNLSPLVDELSSTLLRWYRALPLLLLALVVCVTITYTGHWLAGMNRFWERLAPNVFLADLLAQTFRIAAFILGLVIALSLIGANTLTGTVLGGAGVVGIAVGFAVRDTLENYFASILLSVRQPFRVGDHVLINEHEGNVVRLTSRATVLLTLDGNHLRIPNAVVFKGVILNYSSNPERRFDFELGVDADDDPIAALGTGIEAISTLPFVLLEPEPSGHISAVGDSNILLQFQAWINQREADFLKARSRAISVAKQALEDKGFTLPEPIYRLRWDNLNMQDNPLRVLPGEHLREPIDRNDSDASPKEENEAYADLLDVSPDTALESKVIEEQGEAAETNLLDATKPIE